jgi:hypothetical protein
MQSSDIHGQLDDLKSEVVALLILAHRLSEQIRGTIAQIEPPAKGPALRDAALAYMAQASNAEVRATLIQARGERGAAVFRTKLNSDLEALAGRRHPVAGRAQVTGNGVHAG